MSGQPDRARRRDDTARRHRDALQGLQRDPGALEELLRRAGRRRGPGRRFAGVDVRRAGRRAVLVLPQDLLVRVDDRGDAALGLVSAAGLVGEPVAGLDGRVVRVATAAAAPRDVASLRRSLDAAGLRSSLVQLTPTGVVMKSTVTPEPPGQQPPAAPPATGERGLPVVVLDTGLAVSGRGDGWLSGLEHDGNTDPLDRWPEPNGYLDLAAGHGTFVAGLVQRVDPLLDLSVVRVVDSDGLADEVEVAVALVRTVRERLTPGGRLVVNLSLGSETLDDRPPVALEVALALVREVEAERSGEVLLVASAGNDGSDVRCWPAAFAETDPRVVAVAALAPDGSTAPWSTHGPWVTCSTTGEAVLSTYVTGTEDPAYDPAGEAFGPDAWAWWTGTSFAAPQVAALVASRARTSGSSLADALAAVLATAARQDPAYGALLPPAV